MLSSFLPFIWSYGGKSRLGKKGKVLVTQSYLTLCDPMDCSPPGSSVHGILQARILTWVTMSFSRGSSRPRYWSQSLALQADSLPSEPPGKLSWGYNMCFFLHLESEFSCCFSTKRVCAENIILLYWNIFTWSCSNLKMSGNVLW